MVTPLSCNALSAGLLSSCRFFGVQFPVMPKKNTGAQREKTDDTTR
ncbi:hypothetical protein DAQ1742_03422 [Dickeya aquatica]|uniref:Uncharacterized protein n=1 Tax=Dickeya aquatica TaxID=1401087 RepID=A0A375ADR0_9GAMM|nr:hypothetical protein DAQ1742_03422 [Dickeya aquatica]